MKAPKIYSRRRGQKCLGFTVLAKTASHESQEFQQVSFILLRPGTVVHTG